MQIQEEKASIHLHQLSYSCFNSFLFPEDTLGKTSLSKCPLQHPSLHLQPQVCTHMHVHLWRRGKHLFHTFIGNYCWRSHTSSAAEFQEKKTDFFLCNQAQCWQEPRNRAARRQVKLGHCFNDCHSSSHSLMLTHGHHTHTATAPPIGGSGKCKGNTLLEFCNVINSIEERMGLVVFSYCFDNLLEFLCCANLP